MSLSLSK